MAASGMVIPANERCGRLKDVVFWLADSLLALRAKKVNLFPGQMPNLLLLAYPWLAVEVGPDEAQEKILAQDRQGLSALGFQGERSSPSCATFSSKINT